MTRIIRQAFEVAYHYPVIFTKGVFDVVNGTLAELLNEAISRHPSPRVMVYVDQGIYTRRRNLPEEITHYIRHINHNLKVFDPIVLSGGEAMKTDLTCHETILHDMVQSKMDRHSYVMIVGGGATLDAVGYAASLVHRGIRTIRLPTTVLAQNDAGIGVKTAINHKAGKNFLGTFAPPWAVINDSDFIETLPDEDWRNGIAEAFKVAMIKDATFLNWLCENSEVLAIRDGDTMGELIYRCAELHLKHIRESGDAFEMGQARPLDFGHWSAHQLEAMTNYRVGHGRAVAIGIVLDSFYAVNAGMLSMAAADLLFDGLVRVGFDLWIDELDRQDSSGRLELLNGLENFREHLGGRLCITLPTGIGDSTEVGDMNQQYLHDALTELKSRTGCVNAMKKA